MSSLARPVLRLIIVIIIIVFIFATHEHFHCLKLLFTCLIKQVDMDIYKKPLGGMHIGQKKKRKTKEELRETQRIGT